MLKKRLFCLLLCAAALAAFTACAEPVAIAPEVVAGKIMGYVINNDGAAVYKDVFVEGANMTPVETIEYGTEVEIQTLGLGYCRLRREGKDLLYVRTRDLSFSDEAFGNQLAIVFLKRSNKLPLHKTASAKSKRMTDVPDGSYVVVLEKGDTFSHVLYGKYDGYLQNAYLSFRVAWPEEVFQGKLRDPDKPKHVTTVNLRSADSPNGKKVTTVPTFNKKTKKPTIVTVLQIKGDWAEVETDGARHGYLRASWVELLEPVTEEPAQEEATESGAEPAEPEEPAEPAQTEEVTEAAKPEEAAEPAETVEAVEEAQPEVPAEPVQPEEVTEEPAEPAQPEEAEQPEEPEEPEEPAAADGELPEETEPEEEEGEPLIDDEEEPEEAEDLAPEWEEDE